MIKRFLFVLFLFMNISAKLERVIFIEVLTDIELAKGLSQFGEFDIEETFFKNVEYILKIKNIQLEDFQETIDFYSKNISDFIEIYEEVNKILSKEDD